MAITATAANFYLFYKTMRLQAAEMQPPKYATNIAHYRYLAGMYLL